MTRQDLKITVLSTAALLFGIFCIMILRPIPKGTFENCTEVSGKLIRLGTAGINDITFILDGDQHIYYINRGLEKDLTLAQLKSDLLNRTIKLYYVNHWTPLDWNSRVRHIARLEYSSQTIYNEMST